MKHTDETTAKNSANERKEEINTEYPKEMDYTVPKLDEDTRPRQDGPGGA